MRDLLYKNLTSDDKKRRVISSSEIVDKSGVRTIVRRHFVYLVKEVDHDELKRSPSHLFVIKEHNTKQRIERFYCRMKGNVYAVCNGKVYNINFMHSLRISLVALQSGKAEYSVSEEDV